MRHVLFGIVLLGIMGCQQDKFAEFLPIGTTDSALIGTATALNPLPQGRTLGAAVAVGNRLFYVGGLASQPNATRLPSATVYTATVQANGTLSAWTATASLAEARYAFALATDGVNLWAVGGFADATTRRSSIEHTTINPDGSLNPWLHTAPLPEARGGLAASVQNSHLYVFGGCYELGCVSIIGAGYDASGNLGAWVDQDTSLMLLGRMSNAIEVGGQQAYMHSFEQGGMVRAQLDGVGIMKWNGVWAYGLRAYMSLATNINNTSLIMTGGVSTANSDYNLGQSFEGRILPFNLVVDPVAGSWFRDTDLPQVNMAPSSVRIGSNLYVMGGANNWDGVTIVASPTVYGQLLQ